MKWLLYPPNSYYLEDSGTANAVIVTIAPLPPLTSWSELEGVEIGIKVAANNTGASTLAVVGLTGAKAIKKNGTSALESGDLLAGAIYEFVYDGTNAQLASVAVSKAELDLKVDKSSIVTAFQGTPDNTHLAGEKLTKDSLDALNAKTVLPANVGYVSPQFIGLPAPYFTVEDTAITYLRTLSGTYTYRKLISFVQPASQSTQNLTALQAEGISVVRIDTAGGSVTDEEVYDAWEALSGVKIVECDDVEYDNVNNTVEVETT